MHSAQVHGQAELAPSRVIILAIRPEVDGGRYAAKRVVGDRVEVEVDLVTDGHDVVRGVLLHKPPGATAWEEIELVSAGNDTWCASFTATALGRHAYTAIAWVDAFGSWRHGFERKVNAGNDVSVELVEGAMLVEAATKRSQDPALAKYAAALRGSQPIGERIALALGPELTDAMNRAPDRPHAARYRSDLELHVERPLAASSTWYEMFPRSMGPAGRHGTLRDAEKMLDYVAELGFDIVYLPPIHPIGRAFRKGPDNSPTAGPDDPGSPWAIGGPEGGHTSVHPQLGTIADFDHFVGEAAKRKLEVALDIAFQCSPDHPWVKQHPDWFKQRPDGTIQYAENPPKKYQDVYPFDFESRDWKNLWAALRDVFLFWAGHGVRVFRVDNPHTKPIPFWEWCLREVQAKYPDAIFLAEAFTRPKLMYALAKSGYSQGYTYFTWRVTKADLESYLRELVKPPTVDLYRPNFWPTTPDIFPDHLVHGGRPAFVQRVILAATLGASYGIYGPSYELLEHEPRPGVEELAQNEKYQLRTWDVNRPDSIRHVIARLNKIRREHPALSDMRSLQFHGTDNELVMAYSKQRGDSTILCVVNLDPHHRHRAWLDLDLEALGVPHDRTFQVHDLLSGARFAWRGSRNFVEIDPAQIPAHIFELRRFARSENQFEYFL
ncbi:MAG TPA: alpha-1,4-glucan--maltose-1-phosphate maltosyltransferase [Kofleriaceae bacterium]|nr:alpha-1,4-glucan--maltose-1-phosphate maltosyltransferase [Kofleriaceae bacterium]